MESKHSSPFQTPNLDRGLMILELLNQFPQGLILSEISRRLDIPKKSCQRILGTLTFNEYLYKNEKDMTFSLTSKMLRIGSGAIWERNLIEEAVDVMRELRDVIGETVTLCGVVEGAGIVLEQIASRHQIRIVVDPGTSYDFHCAAPGKVQFAYMSESDKRRLLNEIQLSRYTDNTITDHAVLEHELQSVLKSGYALDNGEGHEGINCVAAPIFDRSQAVIAALSITGPVQRMPYSKLPELAPVIIEHANRISKKLQ